MKIVSLILFRFWYVIKSLFFCPGLDMEYRYWSFMEAHPAHASLSFQARTEAVEVLTWAWTGMSITSHLFVSSHILLDRLLPSHGSIPAPFTQEECHELLSLLRSFGGQSIIYSTRFDLSLTHSQILNRAILVSKPLSTRGPCPGLCCVSVSQLLQLVDPL